MSGAHPNSGPNGMYSSRGIGRQAVGGRHSDPDRNRGQYQSSPDINYRPEASDYNRNANIGNDRDFDRRGGGPQPPNGPPIDRELDRRGAPSQSHRDFDRRHDSYRDRDRDYDRRGGGPYRDPDYDRRHIPPNDRDFDRRPPPQSDYPPGGPRGGGGPPPPIPPIDPELERRPPPPSHTNYHIKPNISGDYDRRAEFTGGGGPAGGGGGAPLPPSDRKDYYRDTLEDNYKASPTDGYTPPPPALPPSRHYTPPPAPAPQPPPSYSRPALTGGGGPPPPQRPPAQSSVANFAPYGVDEDGEPLTKEEMKERQYQESLKNLFHGVNSIDDLITIKEQYNAKESSLKSILEKTAVREGDIQRNRNRNRANCKDPELLEMKKLSEDVKQRLEEVCKFKVEIDKRIRAYNKAIKEAMANDEPDVKEGNSKVGESVDKPSNYEAQLLQNSLITTTVEDEESEEDEFEYENSTREYFDAGSHWCRDCDKMVPKIEPYFEHLHSQKHWESATNELKPWRKVKRPNISKICKPSDPMGPKKSIAPKIRTPLKGAQFLIPLKGFYCPLCSQYLADDLMAEEHLKSAKHNRIYNRFICLNVDYEHKWNADKGKALNRHQVAERKRVKDEEQKELEKKKIKDEQKVKEEKEAKKRRREEENKQKEKENKQRDREERERDRSLTNNSSDRFRLKSVTMDLNTRDGKSKRDKERGREKERKRTRIYSSDSDSSPSPPRKKRTYFGDPYEDPKLKLMSFVPLNRLNKRTAKKYHCPDLIKYIEDAYLKPKTPSIATDVKPSSPIKMDFDNKHDDKHDNKELKSAVDDILKGLGDDDDDDNDIKPQKENVVKIEVSPESPAEPNGSPTDEKPKDILIDKNSDEQIDDKPPDEYHKVDDDSHESIGLENQLQMDIDVGVSAEPKDESGMRAVEETSADENNDSEDKPKSP